MSLPDDIASRALHRLRSAAPELDRLLADAAVASQVSAVAIASDFAVTTLTRQPKLLPELLDDGGAASPPPVLTAENRSEWATLLRRYRIAESTRLVWRDVAGLDDVPDTLAGSTALAERCLQLGLAALESEFVSG